MPYEPNFQVEWLLKNANVVAIGEAGQVINITGVDIRIIEGRTEQHHTIQDGYRVVLQYELNFYLADCEMPDESSQSESSLALVGTLEDGRMCKIVGAGMVGHDNLGQIEGTFWSPPRIELVAAETPMLKPEHT